MMTLTSDLSNVFSSLCSDHLLQPGCLSSGHTGSVPPECLHGGRAVQPGSVWFPRPLPAQKLRQWRLPPSQPRHPQLQAPERQADGDRGARRRGQGSFSRRLSVPVLQRVSGGGLRRERPAAPTRGGRSSRDVDFAASYLTVRLCAPLLHITATRSSTTRDRIYRSGRKWNLIFIDRILKQRRARWKSFCLHFPLSHCFPKCQISLFYRADSFVVSVIINWSTYLVV